MTLVGGQLQSLTATQEERPVTSDTFTTFDSRLSTAADETSGASNAEETFLSLSTKKLVKPPPPDPNDFVRSVYRKRCHQLNTIPVGTFLRKCGAPNLNLRNLPLGPRGASAIAAPLAVSTTILHLELGGCDIRPEGMKYLTHSLIDNTYIEYLGLSANNLSALGCQSVCQLMMYNQCITSLDLSDNQLGDDSAKYLLEFLQETSFLKKLNLSNNKLSNASIKLIGQAIGGNESLEVLDLSWNMFRLSGVKELAKGLKDNIRLRTLDLSYNGLGYDGAVALGTALTENTILQELGLASNNLVDKAVFKLALSLQTNEGLLRLNLSHNPMTTFGACSLLKSLLKNENMTLSFINLQGVSVDSDFAELRHQIRIIIPEFSVQHDAIPLRKNINPISRLFRHLVREGLTIQDVFLMDESAPDKTLTKTELADLLSKSEVPLSEMDVAVLSNYLDTENKAKVNLSLLYDRWVEYRSRSRPAIHA